MSTKVQDIPQAAADVVSAFRQAVSKTNALTSASGADRKTHIEKLTRDATAKIEALQSDYDAATRSTSKATTVVGNATEQLLDETKKGKAWDKLKAALDNNLRNADKLETPDVLHVITDAVDKAVATKDVATLSVMRDELPDYLNSNDLDMYAKIVSRLMRPADSLVQPEASSTKTGDVRYKRVEVTLSGTHNAINLTDPTVMGHTAITAELDVPGYEIGTLIAIAGVPEVWKEKDAKGKPVEPAVDFPVLT